MCDKIWEMNETSVYRQRIIRLNVLAVTEIWRLTESE